MVATIDFKKLQRDDKLIIGKGEKLYKKLVKELEEHFYGKQVGINIDTGEYAIGETKVDVLDKFDWKFGKKARGYFRVIGKGHPDVHL